MTAQEFQKLGIEYCSKHKCSMAGEPPCPLEDHMMCIQKNGKIGIVLGTNGMDIDFIKFAKEFNFMVNEIISEGKQ